MYLPVPYKISYDTKKFQFKEIIHNILEIDVDLEKLHTIKHYDKLIRENDQSTIWHKKYYANFNEKFYPTYLSLIKEIKDIFEYDELIYQKIPTFRVQLNNGNLAVGEWHKDKSYNHGVSEVNFWLPFTDTNEYNSVWIESKENRGDFKPYLVKYGEILVFSGANLMHGNKENISESTRVSIDFRLVDSKKFIPSDKPTINTNTKFIIGEYFKKD
jgi:ectoine hydroxylase-related dioxygenase (phytanoyl-CoA dioxygenase family)